MPAADAASRPSGAGAAPPLLEMSGITKRFPGVVANADVSFDVRRGEVHALLGENGAGKSTLMKILYGLHRPDEGEVRISGEPVRLRGPKDAIARRIGMIHQHFMLVPTLTVAENVALGLRPKRWPLTDAAAVADQVAELGERYHLQVDPSAYVWQLAVGERQRVEILRALYRDAELLVLDEPTAVLTPQEVDDLFHTLRRLREDDRGLIFISHKLHEVLDLADRVTVLRNGRVVETRPTAGATREDLARSMVGRELHRVVDDHRAGDTEVRLAITGLSVDGDRGTRAVDDAHLEVRAGEIVGVAGVSGNGQRELAEAIAALRDPTAGSINIDGLALDGCGPEEARDLGIGYVPEERMRDGAIGAFTVAENLLLLDHDRAPFSRRGVMIGSAIREHCARLIEQFSVKTPSAETPVQALSGGNIQKLIMARELDGEPAVLVAAQPTRGVDIGAAEQIHAALRAQRDRGAAVLLLSEDLDEILDLCDRVAVMFEGRVVGVVDRAEATPAALGLLMAGVTEPAPTA
ncbi:MAG: ABC transporter ATP-binding protein [Actinomycetota bacterium]|nr:ABC transporter ATP-binding protein [Actinomycetota bacterium]